MDALLIFYQHHHVLHQRSVFNPEAFAHEQCRLDWLVVHRLDAMTSESRQRGIE